MLANNGYLRVGKRRRPTHVQYSSVVLTRRALWLLRYYELKKRRRVVELEQEQEQETPSQLELRVSPFVGHDDVAYAAQPAQSQQDFYEG